MKKMLIAVFVLTPKLVFASMLGLYPYFKPLDLNHLQPIAGALIDVKEIHLSEASAQIPLITHSKNDGCALPSIVCEDWTPLAVGGSVLAGEWTFVAGPLVNVLPIAQGLAYRMTPDRLPGLQRMLAPRSESQAVTMSAGPQWQYKSSTNKGYFRVFTGAALHF